MFIIINDSWYNIRGSSCCIAHSNLQAQIPISKTSQSNAFKRNRKSRKIRDKSSILGNNWIRRIRWRYQRWRTNIRQKKVNEKRNEGQRKKTKKIGNVAISWRREQKKITIWWIGREKIKNLRGKAKKRRRIL